MRKQFIGIMIIFILSALIYSVTTVAAQGIVPVNDFTTVLEVGKLKVTPQDLLKKYNDSIDPETSAIMGPIDIIVGTTDKGANGIKYNNVPFLLTGNGFIIFPNGDSHKGKPVYVITSNFTVRLK